MRKLCDETRRLISLLPERKRTFRSKAWSLRRWRRGDPPRTTDLFVKIAATGEYAAIPFLRDYTVCDDPWTREASQFAVHALMTHVRLRDVVWLDEKLRSWWLMSMDWTCHLTPRRLSSLVKVAAHQSALLRLASTHPSGFVREKAVRLLDEIVHDGSELPFLLVRCNDWVSPVQLAAEKAVRSRLTGDYATHFLGGYWLVRRLATCRRAGHGRLLEKISGFLAASLPPDAFYAKLCDPDVDVRRTSLELLLTSRREPLVRIVERAAESQDHMLRLRAVSVAISQLKGVELDRVLLRFVRDSAKSVRSAALMRIAESCPGVAGLCLGQALLDRHSSVRELARFYLLRIDADRDFRAYYLSAIGVSSGRALTAAIAGLGEVGEVGDADLIRPFLDDGVPRNRRTALRALSRLRAPMLVSYLCHAIDDDSPSVSRTAAQLLRQSPPDSLYELAERVTHAHALCHLLSLIAQCSTWRALCVILDACLRREKKVVVQATCALRTWIDHKYAARGSERERSRACERLKEVKGVLPRPIVEALESMIDA